MGHTGWASVTSRRLSALSHMTQLGQDQLKVRKPSTYVRDVFSFFPLGRCSWELFARKLVTSCPSDEVPKGRNSFSCHTELAEDASPLQKTGLRMVLSSIRKVSPSGSLGTGGSSCRTSSMTEKSGLGGRGQRAKGLRKVTGLLEKLPEEMC